MKKFYSVKEAAKILGFSTNTVYTHLEEGSLAGKRVGGRGRFKIPYSELAPYLEAPNEERVVSTTGAHAVMPQKIGIGWTVAGVVFGAVVGYSAIGVSMPKFVTDIASATLSYSGRSSAGFGNMVDSGTAKVGGGLKALASSFGFGTSSKTVIVDNASKTDVNTSNQIAIKVPGSTGINVREEATTSAKVVAKLTTSKVAEKIGEKDGWTEIAIANYPSGWVNNQFVETTVGSEVVLGAATDVKGKLLTINETSLGTLNVREAPGGNIIGKVNSGETYKILDKSGDWYLIEIPGGTNGWISSQFATLQ